MMGYNPVLILAVFGDLAFPLPVMLWLPKTHPKYRSKNDLTGDFITHLKRESDRRGGTLDQVDILFYNAYCVKKVVCKAQKSGLSVVSKACNNHKFKLVAELFTH